MHTAEFHTCGPKENTTLPVCYEKTTIATAGLTFKGNINLSVSNPEIILFDDIFRNIFKPDQSLGTKTMDDVMLICI